MTSNNIIPFKSSNDNDQPRDTLTNFFYLLLNKIPATEIEQIIFNSKGNYFCENIDLYNYARKLATKVSPTL